LSESLLADGQRVLGIDCFNANYGRVKKLRNLARSQEFDSFDFVPLDLSHGDLGDLVADCDVVFHLAAEPGVRESWGTRFEGYVRNNILATHALLAALRPWPDRRLVYASSSSVYGDAATLPTPESTLPQPVSPYGATKLAAEHMCHLHHANFGLRVVSLRYFSVYGPRQRPDMAFSRFCRAALANESIDIYGDGTQTRDFTYVDDIVAATRAAADASGVDGQVFNAGGGSRNSVRDTLKIITELAGRELDVRLHPRSLGDTRDTAADTSRAAARLAYAPSIGLREGLERQFGWTEAQLGPEQSLR
jgi:UDP-glucose 4-epimerase